MNKSVVTIALGTACGLVTGWLFRTAQSKRIELPSQPSMLDRMRMFERQLYRDGLERANTIEAIKQDVENRIYK